MANLREREENEGVANVIKIRHALEEKHKKIISLKTKNAISMQNFYNLNVPQEYIELYKDIFGYLDDDIIFDENTRKILDRMINRMPQEYMKLLKSRYGLAGNKAMNLLQIAEARGVSHQYIRALNDKSIKKMRIEASRQKLSELKNIANEEFIRE